MPSPRMLSKVSGPFDVPRYSTAHFTNRGTILVIFSMRVSELLESAIHDGSMLAFIAFMISSFQERASRFSV